MISELIELNRVIYRDGFEDWQQAVRVSCEPLIADGSINPEYVDAIIACILEYGPYIVIAPNICIPHAMAGGTGVNRSAVSLMVTQQAVSFEDGNPEKDARLFFVLAAKDADEHMANLVRLVEMLSDEEYVEKLLKTTSVEELKLLA